MVFDQFINSLKIKFLVKKIIKYRNFYYLKSMHAKQSHVQSFQSSPSELIAHDEASQMSLNPSYLQKAQLNAPSGTQQNPNRQKKRLKFDQVCENDLEGGSYNIDTPQSDQEIQIEFALGNCIKKLSDFIKSQKFSHLYVVILVLFLINCTLQAAQISESVVTITENIDLALQVFFTISIIAKLTQYQAQHIFWMILDIITNICGYVSYGFSEQEQPIRYLKAVKVLRLFMIIKESTYLQVPAAKLINSLSSVGKILFPAVLFIYFYAVIGLYSFRDYEYTKCRDPANKLLTQDWTVYEEEIFLCGEKQCPVVQGVQYECLNPIDFGVQPDPQEVKNLKQGEGLMRYSNIFYSLFSTFKQTFITGSSRLMILSKQVTNYYYVMIYYLSFIYLLAYIYLNIFYGLMITNEEECHETRRESSFELKLQRFSQKPKYTKELQDMEQKDKKSQKAQKAQQLPKTTQKASKSMILSVDQGINEPGLKKSSNQLQNISQEQEKSQFEQVIDFHKSRQDAIVNSTNQRGNRKALSKISKFVSQTESKRPQFQQNFSQDSNSQDSQIDEQNTLKYGQLMKKYYLINHVIVIFCSINILIDYEGQSYSEKLIVDSIDFAFFWIYLVEVVFRIVVHKMYVPKQPMDRAFKLDFIVFIFCLGGLIYEISTAQHVEHFVMASDNISKLFRTLKYLRIFLLISSTPYFNQARIIFNSTLEAVYSVRYLSSLWLVVLVIFSIMGYHMFHGKTKVNEQEHLDLQNGHPFDIAFEGIVDSFIYTVFIFFNQEWDEFLFEQYVSHQVLIVIWQLIVLVIGLQILSKYFMALMMKQLGDKLNEQEQLAQENQEQILQNQSEFDKMAINQNYKINKIAPEQNSHRPSFTFKLKTRQSGKDPQMVKKPSNRDKRVSVNATTGLVQVRKSSFGPSDAKKQKEKRQSMMRNLILRENDSQKQQNPSLKTNKPKDKQLQNSHITPQCNQIAVESASCMQVPKIKIMVILKSKCYTIFRVAMILISIVCTLVANPHQDPNSTKSQVFLKIWYATVAFFGLQIILSVFTFGLIKQKGYLRSIMNWIYIIVFAIQIISIVPGLSDNAHLQSLLSFRILRIFVFVELKYEADADMRLTIVGFWRLMPKVLNLLAITITMYGFFAIILVKLYKDDFYYCDGYEEGATILTNKDCMNWGGSWIQRKMNVSNIFSSLLYLFLLATSEGWSVQVIEAATLAGPNNQPQYESNVWLEYFFSIFFFFGNMIMLNVFIGLSVYNFQKIKSQVTGLTRLSKDNKMWFSIKNTIHRLSPTMKDSPPDNLFSQYVHTFKNSQVYKIVNIILFILFMVNMSLYTTNMSKTKQKILDTVLDIFIGIFIFEYVVTWIAYGFRTIKQKKFWFETIAIIYFIILFIVSKVESLQPKTSRILYGIAICLLAIRYFALLNEVEFVRKMINSLVSIFPQTANIWLLMFIVLFSYAVIGIYFFSYLKIGQELNQFDQNFTNLQNAVYALLKFSTLESPMLQIIDATVSIQPNSVCYDLYSYQDFVQHGRMGCGNPAAGYIFFLSFHLIYSLILLSTLLAVIVDAYSQVRREQESMVNKFQLQEVQKQWQNYDPQATGYISYRDFWIFTAKLVKIYKVNKEQLLSHETKQSFLKSLQIPIYEDQNGILSFQFHEVVEALTRIVLKQKMGSDWDTKQADKVFKNHHHHQSEMKMFKKSVYDSSHVLTLIIIKSGLKTWKRKAVNTDNQQNFQNLFSLAKRQKQKNETNNEMSQTASLTRQQVKTDLKTKVSLQVDQKQNPVLKGESTQQKNSYIKRTDSQKLQQSIQQVIRLQNGGTKQPIMKHQPIESSINRVQNRMVTTTKETYSKVKSPRETVNNIYSQRARQNLTFNNISNQKQQDQTSQLQHIDINIKKD